MSVGPINAAVVKPKTTSATPVRTATKAVRYFRYQILTNPYLKITYNFYVKQCAQYGLTH